MLVDISYMSMDHGSAAETVRDSPGQLTHHGQGGKLLVLYFIVVIIGILLYRFLRVESSENNDVSPVPTQCYISSKKTDLQTIRRQ
jgi:hypothetical protein